MSSAIVVKNKFDGNDYRVSVVRVRKHAYIPDPMAKFYPKGENPVWESTGESVLKPRKFATFLEAAVFNKGSFWKPLFVIECGSAIDPMVESLKGLTETILKKKIDLTENKITEEEFTKFVHHIVADEKIEDLMSGESDVYERYGFTATEHDMWQLFFLGKMRMIFIERVPSL